MWFAKQITCGVLSHYRVGGAYPSTATTAGWWFTGRWLPPAFPMPSRRTRGDSLGGGGNWAAGWRAVGRGGQAWPGLLGFALHELR